MNGKSGLISLLLGLLAIILIILHLTGVFMPPAHDIPTEPDAGSRRFDRITIYNLSDVGSEGSVIFHIYRRQDPSVIWKTITLNQPVLPRGQAGRVFHWSFSDPMHQIVKVKCSFPFPQGQVVEATVQAELAADDPVNLNHPALNSATFWFGSRNDDGTAPNRLCGEGVLGDHTTWIDD